MLVKCVCAEVGRSPPSEHAAARLRTPAANYAYTYRRDSAIGEPVIGLVLALSGL